MQIHQLVVKNNKQRKRIGRGGKRGTYSGRGGKGQTARAGAGVRPAIRDFIKKVHKLKGVPASRYKKQGSKVTHKVYQIVNIESLEKKFNEGDMVSPASLLEKKLIRRVARKLPNVKILGNGKLTKKLKFDGVKMSKSVAEITR